MIKHLVVIFTLLCLGATSAVSQEHTPLPAAKAAYDRAKDAAAKGYSGDPKGFNTAVQLLQKAITLDPEFYAAHQEYIQIYKEAAAPDLRGPDQKKSDAEMPAFENAGKELEQQYLKLETDHPEKAVYAWALGIAFTYDDPKRSNFYFKQAIQIDPKCAPAYNALSTDADVLGDI